MRRRQAKRIWRRGFYGGSRFNFDRWWAAGIKLRVPAVTMAIMVFGTHGAKRWIGHGL